MNPAFRNLTIAAAFALTLAAAAGANLPSGPAAAASAIDARSEALSLVTDLRGALDGYVVRLGSASANAGRLSVSGSIKNRDLLAAELVAVANGIEGLDAKLKVLDARIAALSTVAPTRKTSPAADSAKSGPASSGALRVACEVSDRAVGEAEAVTYSAVVTGGVTPYSYLWSGAFEGNAPTQKITFIDAGTYRETLTVTDKRGKKISDDCPRVDVGAEFSAGSVASPARAKKASIAISSPARGAKIKAGNPATIAWKQLGLAQTDPVDIYLNVGSDGVTYFIASAVGSLDSERGSHVWSSAGTVAKTSVPYGSYTLNVCTLDNLVCDETSVTLQRP